MIPALDDELHAKLHATHHMILSRDLGEQKILQSDWTKDKTGHT